MNKLNWIERNRNCIIYILSFLSFQTKCNYSNPRHSKTSNYITFLKYLRFSTSWYFEIVLVHTTSRIFTFPTHDARITILSIQFLLFYCLIGIYAPIWTFLTSFKKKFEFRISARNIQQFKYLTKSLMQCNYFDLKSN